MSHVREAIQPEQSMYGGMPAFSRRSRMLTALGVTLGVLVVLVVLG